MITVHCPKTLNSKLFVLRGCVSLCSPSLTIITKAEILISIVKKKKNEKRLLVNKKFQKLEKEYRDCIKRKWRQDWDMNETL